MATDKKWQQVRILMNQLDTLKGQMLHDLQVDEDVRGIAGLLDEAWDKLDRAESRLYELENR